MMFKKINALMIQINVLINQINAKQTILYAIISLSMKNL